MLSRLLRFRLLPALALLCMGLAGCGKSPAPEAGAGTAAGSGQDGILTFALEADFPSLDPLRISNMAERQVALAIMDPLFDLDAKGELVPVLAESFGYSDSVIDLAVQQVPTSGHVPVNEWRPSWLSAECRGPS